MKHISIASVIIVLIAVLIWIGRKVVDYTVIVIDSDGKVMGFDQQIVSYPISSNAMKYTRGGDGMYRKHGPQKPIELPLQMSTEISAFMDAHRSDVCQWGGGFIDISSGNIFLRTIMAYGPNPDISRGWEYRDGALSHVDFSDNTKAIAWSSFGLTSR